MTFEQKRKTLALGLFVCIVFLPIVVFAVDPGGIVPCSGTECSFADLAMLVNNIIDFLLVNIAFPISALFFAWAGFLYLTAAGDTGKINKAHSIFSNVFWGLILALAAWLIIDFITSTLTGEGWALNPFNH